MKKHELLVQDIISKIYQRTFTEKLPAERQLAEMYNLSRFSIRKALSKLEAIGLISVRIGAGYYVNSSIAKTSLIYNSITENNFNQISYKKIKLRKVLPSIQEKQIFSLDDNQYIWKMKRLRLVNNIPVQIENAILPCDLFPKINDSVVENSIQKFVINSGFEIENYLTTYKSVNIDKVDAELLNCKRNTAVMNIINRGFLKSGKIFISSNIIDINYECTYLVPFNNDHLLFRNK